MNEDTTRALASFAEFLDAPGTELPDRPLQPYEAVLALLVIGAHVSKEKVAEAMEIVAGVEWKAAPAVPAAQDERPEPTEFVALRAKGVLDADDNLDAWDTPPYSLAAAHVKALNKRDPAAMWRFEQLYVRAGTPAYPAPAVPAAQDERLTDEQIMALYDAEIGKGGSADSVVVRTVRAALKPVAAQDERPEIMAEVVDIADGLGTTMWVKTQAGIDLPAGTKLVALTTRTNEGTK